MDKYERAIAGLQCLYDDDSYPELDDDILLAISVLIKEQNRNQE